MEDSFSTDQVRGWFGDDSSTITLIVHIISVIITSPLVFSLFNLYAEYIMQNARLDDLQTEVKIARGNTNNLRYADDTTLIAEIEEELKSLLMKEKSE